MTKLRSLIEMPYDFTGRAPDVFVLLKQYADEIKDKIGHRTYRMLQTQLTLGNNVFVETWINDHIESGELEDINDAPPNDKAIREYVRENLRNWFKKEKWKRIDTQGNIKGDCGTMPKGKKTQRCLPAAKARSLSKKDRAATSRKKTKSNKQFVSNTKKAKVKLNK